MKRTAWQHLQSCRLPAVAMVVAGFATAVVQLGATFAGGDAMRAIHATQEQLVSMAMSHVCTDGFRAAVGLTSLMPLYMVIFAAFTKPCANIMVFGPPSPKVKKFNFTFVEALKRDSLTLLRFLLISLMMWTIFTDLRRIGQVWKAQNLTTWERWNLSLLCLAVSPNLPAAASAFGLHSIYDDMSTWLEHHGMVMTSVELMVQSQGAFFVVYQAVVQGIYVPIGLLLAGWLVPAAIAYCYVAALLLVLLVGMYLFMLGRFEAGTKRWVNEPPDESLLNELSTDQQKACMDNMRGNSDYSTEKACVMKLGMTVNGIRSYLFFPILPPFILIFTTISVRFYSGCGYWSSLTQTWEDRHMIHYLQAVSNQTIGAEETLWTWI